jgi:hypothetical protein
LNLRAKNAGGPWLRQVPTGPPAGSKDAAGRFFSGAEAIRLFKARRPQEPARMRRRTPWPTDRRCADPWKRGEGAAGMGAHPFLDPTAFLQPLWLEHRRSSRIKPSSRGRRLCWLTPRLPDGTPRQLLQRDSRGDDG